MRPVNSNQTEIITCQMWLYGTLCNIIMPILSRTKTSQTKSTSKTISVLNPIRTGTAYLFTK